MARGLSNVVAFDDAPFAREHRGDVPLVGAVFAGVRLDGVLIGRVRRDGANATRAMSALVAGSHFAGHVQAVLLQGIAVAGFNVVDIAALHEALGLPVLVVARRQPDMEGVRKALFGGRVPGGAHKWRLVEKAGPMEPVAGLWVQRAGLTLAEADHMLRRLRLHGLLPEPIRVAHLIAGALGTGHSRGRA
ncbi:MAG: DUF99 family protein [Deltaproteobacteria bacterium]|nr:DUF99 family protein [Deltaproteobacteria bacterium]